jgi:hypothetical protein
MGQAQHAGGSALHQLATGGHGATLLKIGETVKIFRLKQLTLKIGTGYSLTLGSGPSPMCQPCRSWLGTIATSKRRLPIHKSKTT